MQTTQKTDYTTCPNCNRSTSKEDYISFKDPKIITKTCLKCRLSVQKSLKKKKELSPSTKNTDCIKQLIEILQRTDVELTEKEQKSFLAILDKMSNKK